MGDAVKVGAGIVAEDAVEVAGGEPFSDVWSHVFGEEGDKGCPWFGVGCPFGESGALCPVSVEVG